MKYNIVCKYCGRTLFKSRVPFIMTLPIEIQCSQCKKLLQLPDGAEAKLEQEKKIKFKRA